MDGAFPAMIPRTSMGEIRIRMGASRSSSWRNFDPSMLRADGAARSVVAVRRIPASGMCRILGLDPGSRHTGFGLVECRGSETLYIASGAISTTGSQFADRLQQIFHQVRELVS